MPVIAFLGLLWAAVLGPVIYRAAMARRAHFAASFGNGLEALEHAEGFFAPVDRPVADSPAPLTQEARRAALLRSILAGLLVAAALSMVLAVVTAQRAMLAVNLALDDCLLVFVALLVLRRDARARRHSVRPAPVDADAYEPVVVAPLPRPVYSSGVPIIAAPVVGALSGSVATTA